MKNYKLQRTRIISSVPRDVYKAFVEADCLVAGGTVVSVFNNVPINDYDIYCRDIKDTELLLNELKNMGFELKIESKNAYSLLRKGDKYSKRIKVQIIKNKKFCNPDPFETFKYFDFHCCMGAYSFKEDEFYLDKHFLTDNISKMIRINTGTEFPICSMYRTLKYQKKGYTLPGIEMIKLCLAINNLKMKNYVDLKDQLMGIDTQFLAPLTDKLLKDESIKYNFENFKCELDDFIEDYHEEVLKNAFKDEEPEDNSDLFDEMELY